MRIYASISTGYVAELDEDRHVLRVSHLEDRRDCSAPARDSLVALVGDWCALNKLGDSLKPSLASCLDDYHLHRAWTYTVNILSGLSESLEVDILYEIEHLFMTRVSTEALLDHLMIAPLLTTDRARRLARRSLVLDLSSVAVLLDRLIDVQTLLKRFVAHWLNAPIELFYGTTFDKEMLWITACESGVVRKSLEVSDASKLQSVWSQLAFREDIAVTPQDRDGIAKVSKWLACAIYPEGDAGKWANVEDHANEQNQPGSFGLLPNTSPITSFERTTKQIDAIVEAVSIGDDAKARHYVRDLVDDQLRYEGGYERAVKSLCNIAKQAADMFRSDFEKECLDRALSIDPNDAWTLCQYGDHLKRLRQYEHAREVLQHAKAFGESRVVLAGIADVWAQQGEFENAISVYQEIPAWESDIAARTAIADNLRRLGRLDEAEAAYRQLLEEDAEADRALSGIAAILRQRLRLGEALKIYDRILSSNALDKRSDCVYRLIKCSLLKQMKRFEEAYTIADGVVEDVPFSMHARVLRGTLLGLMDREAEGLRAIPEGRPSATYGEWVRNYFRSLLLFKLRRYGEARAMLKAQLEALQDRDDGRNLLRLGTAYMLIHDNKLVQAATVLDLVETQNDQYVKNLNSVLALHLATLESDAKRIEELVSILNDDPELAEIVTCLQRGDFTNASRIELNLLLAASPESNTIAA